MELNNCYCLFGTQVHPIPGYENAPSADDLEKDELRAKALADLGTGSMTYMLNGDQSTIKWYQTLGKDETPVPWSDHKQVYVDGKVLCNGHPVGNVTFTNEPTGNVPTHSFEHGFCTSCGTIDINYKQPVNDFYELADGLDVVWFAALAELGNPAEICRRYCGSSILSIVTTDGQTLEIDNSPENSDNVARLIREGRLKTIHSSEPDLGAVFLKLTGKELDI